MIEKTINGVEITVYNSDQTVSIKPVYEAHSTDKVLEIINRTKELIYGTGKTITWQTF
jgi:hypothetical protein